MFHSCVHPRVCFYFDVFFLKFIFRIVTVKLTVLDGVMSLRWTCSQASFYSQCNRHFPFNRHYAFYYKKVLYFFEGSSLH